MNCTFKDRLDAYDKEINKILDKYGITYNDIYTFSRFLDNEKAYLLKLLLAKYQVHQEELIHLTEVFNNIRVLSNYRKRRLTIVK